MNNMLSEDARNKYYELLKGMNQLADDLDLSDEVPGQFVKVADELHKGLERWIQDHLDDFARESNWIVSESAFVIKDVLKWENEKNLIHNRHMPKELKEKLEKILEEYDE